MTKSKCWLLFKTQMRNEFGRSLKSRGRKMTSFAIGLVLLMFVFYAYMLAYGLGSMGMAEVIPSYGLAITGLLTLFFTALKTNGVLFAYKEYDMVMSLPVKTSTVIASRFMTMYVLNLMLTAVILIPMGIGYAVWEAPGIIFYPAWILGILAAPLIPTTLAALLGTLLILFSSRFKYANAVVTVVSVIGTLAVLVLSVGMGQFAESIDMPEIHSISEMILTQVHRIYPPAALFFQGIARGNAAAMAAFLVGSLLWFYLFVKLISPVYKKLNTSLVTYHTHSNYKLKELKASSQIHALYKKELKRFFSSTIYCLNMGMGCLMTLVLPIALIFVRFDQLDQMTGIPNMAEMAARILPFAISALISMSCTTCVSLSLEGKNLWILKSMPIEDITICKSKILMNLTLQIPAALLAALIINIRFPMVLSMRILMFVTPVVCALFNSLWGMFINLKMPDYNWTSETALVKQSLPAMAGTLGGLVGGMIPILAVLALHQIDAGLLTGVMTAVILLGAWGLWGQIRKAKI